MISIPTFSSYRDWKGQARKKVYRCQNSEQELGHWGELSGVVDEDYRIDNGRDNAACQEANNYQNIWERSSSFAKQSHVPETVPLGDRGVT